MVVKSFLPRSKELSSTSSSMLRRKFLCRILLTSGGSGLALALGGCGTSGNTDAVLTDDVKSKRKENLLKGTKPVANKGKRP